MRNGKLTNKKVIEWLFYSQNLMRCIHRLFDHYDKVLVSEAYENSYKIKMKKDDKSTTIGSLFGFMEDQKTDCFLEEYSIGQTSLEQIFNKFAAEGDGKDNKVIKSRQDFAVTREIAASLSQ